MLRWAATVKKVVDANFRQFSCFCQLYDTRNGLRGATERAAVVFAIGSSIKGTQASATAHVLSERSHIHVRNGSVSCRAEQRRCDALIERVP
jgi:hypothetical protein